MKTLYVKPATRVAAMGNDESLLSSSLEMNNEVGDKVQKSKGMLWTTKTTVHGNEASCDQRPADGDGIGLPGI